VSAYEHLAGRLALPAYEALRGRGTFRYRREFAESQWLSPEAIRELQWDRLRRLLRRAYETAPLYRDAFDRLGMKPEEVREPADLARLPVLDKATIRREVDDLISRAFRREQLIRSATGGSTGEPLQFYYDRDSYDRRNAAAMRGDSWAGWRLCGGEFYIWGARLLPAPLWKRAKVKAHHALLRRAVASSFDLSEARVLELVRQYNRMRPRVVVGYANAVYEFARAAQAAGQRLRPPTGVITSAEKLYQYQRALIEEVFGAPVFDRYGCREVMLIGAECEQHRGLHVTADNLYVEVVRDGQLCEPGERGEVLLTDLYNYGMPLIRYKVGDTGSWQGFDCPCGRGLPLLSVVEGRTLDLIRTPDGRVIAGEFFPHLLKDYPSIRRYQVLQEQPDELRIRLALAQPLPEPARAQLERIVGEQVGPRMRVRWETGPQVEIEPTAKFRPVRSLVTASARD
jgi:phenylacetate-CoA ligase